MGQRVNQNYLNESKEYQKWKILRTFKCFSGGERSFNLNLVSYRMIGLLKYSFMFKYKLRYYALKLYHCTPNLEMFIFVKSLV